MHFLRKYLVSFLFTTLAVSHLYAAGWPGQSRLALDESFHVKDFDGMKAEWLELKRDDFRFSIIPPSDWLVVAHDASVSFKMQHRLQNRYNFEILFFKKGEFLQDLTEDSMAVYLKSLNRQHPNAKISLPSENDFVPPSGSLPFFSRLYRIVPYSIVREEKIVDENGRTVKIKSFSSFRDYLVVVQDHLLIYRFRSDDFNEKESLIGNFNRSISAIIATTTFLSE